MIIEKRNIQALREKVEIKFGRTIKTATDCALLATEIEKQGTVINPQTFRRFFGLIKNSGNYREDTKNTLAKYVGFADFSDFEKNITTNELESFFSDINSEKEDKNYWQMSETLCGRIADSPKLLVKYHHRLIKYPLARQFFIEHHPMRDLSATVYAQYFHEYLKYQHNNEARIFAFGFLFMGAFLSENHEFMEVYCKKMDETKLLSEVYVLPAGRKFGVPLLYSWLKNDDKTFEKVFSEMLQARETYREASEKSVCSFEYSVLEHLIFTDKLNEMKFLIENNTFQKFSDRAFVPQDRKENHDEVWKILCSVAYLKMKDYEKCEQYVSSVNLEKLSVGWKKYYSILYYFAKYEFSEPEEKTGILRKIDHLISETYFSYYNNWLEKLRQDILRVS